MFDTSNLISRRILSELSLWLLMVMKSNFKIWPRRCSSHSPGGIVHRGRNIPESDGLGRYRRCPFFSWAKDVWLVPFSSLFFNNFYTNSGHVDQSLPSHLPRITTLKILFSRFLDFRAVPRRSFFQYLRYFITDELEREKLDEFLSREGAVRKYPNVSF